MMANPKARSSSDRIKGHLMEGLSVLEDVNLGPRRPLRASRTRRLPHGGIRIPHPPGWSMLHRT